MRGVRRRVLHCFLDDGLVSGAAGGNKRQRPGCGDREKTIGSHQVLQFGEAGDVCGMALLRICTIASLRLPIPQRRRDTGIQSAKSRKVEKPGWPDVRSALDLAQARMLSCWSLEVERKRGVEGRAVSVRVDLVGGVRVQISKIKN